MKESVIGILLRNVEDGVQERIWRQIKVLHNCYQTCQQNYRMDLRGTPVLVKVQQQNKSRKRHDLPTLIFMKLKISQQ